MGYVDLSRLYTLSAAAKDIGMDRVNLLYHITKGKNPPPFEKIGQRYFFDIEKLRVWYRTTRHWRRTQA